MISLRTNLSSIITQQSLGNTTNRLNLAIERMSTGYKINHASDNAANYSIATNMTTQINSYMVAEDNVLMGMDMLDTMNSSLDLIGDKLTRLRSLCEQATNGTYGDSSIDAIKAEAESHIDEINRILANTEYNGIKTNRKISGFLKEVDITTPEIIVSSADKLADAIENNSIIGVANADVLAELATLVNSGTTCEGKTIVLTSDIDLSNYQDGEGWNPIGNATDKFQGDFNGNGYCVKNLKINRTSATNQGLFGYSTGEISNVGVEGNVSGGEKRIALLVGDTEGDITNCYAKGAVTGTNHTIGGIAGNADANTTISYCYAECDANGMAGVGGLLGQSKSNSSIINCYTTGSVIGDNALGGLVGNASNNISISNCYSTADVTGETRIVGGLIGNLQADSNITNCYATGNVTGTNSIGGLIGYANTNSKITDCYANGNVNGNGVQVGGLIGCSVGDVTNCYATGDVSNSITNGGSTGGLVGLIEGTVRNSYATGNIKTKNYGGGLIGQLGATNASGYIYNCFATGNVDADTKAGGLVGALGYSSIIADSQAYGNIHVKSGGGGLVGLLADGSISTITNCYAAGNVVATTEIAAGLIGMNGSDTNNTINNSYSDGDVTTKTRAGSVLGYYNNGTVNITNCGGSGTITVNGNVITDAYSMSSVPTVAKPSVSADETNSFTFDKLTQSFVNVGIQVGINSGESSYISSAFSYITPNLDSLLANIRNSKNLDKIDRAINSISSSQTNIGAMQNRLDSALEQISINYENLVSSRSTIKDADIGELSASYIQQQILQQAAATLMSTANQSPAIALQLI